MTAANDVDRVALLDFEISFGRLDESTNSWRIELSTLPWLEGTIETTPESTVEPEPFRTMREASVPAGVCL